VTLDVGLIFKLAGIGILVAVLVLVLERADRREYGQLVALAGVTIAFLFVLQLLGNLFTAVRTLFNL